MRIILDKIKTVKRYSDAYSGIPVVKENIAPELIQKYGIKQLNVYVDRVEFITQEPMPSTNYCVGTGHFQPGEDQLSGIIAYDLFRVDYPGLDFMKFLYGLDEHVKIAIKFLFDESEWFKSSFSKDPFIMAIVLGSK